MKMERLIPSLLVIHVLLSSCSILPRNWRRQTHFSAEDLKSEDPLHQIRGIHEIVEQKDQTQLPILLELMLGDEPSVRNQAFWGVTQLTGISQLKGASPEYHFYAPLDERQRAVNAWKEYLKGNPTP